VRKRSQRRKTIENLLTDAGHAFRCVTSVLKSSSRSQEDLSRTINAVKAGRVNFQAFRVDGLTTLHAFPVFIVVNSYQGSLDQLQLSLRPFLAGFGKGLHLQGIHTGEPAYTLLVQVYGVAGQIPGLTGREQFLT
jgi:hypothetical protein